MYLHCGFAGAHYNPVVLSFFEKTNPTPFSIPPLAVSVKTSIAPDDMVQSQPRLIRAYLRACSQFPAYLRLLLKDQYLDEHAGVAVILYLKLLQNSKT
jgi:hypothetical protein